MQPEVIAERLVQELIHNLRTIPDTDEQELGERIDARSKTFEWWVRDFFVRNELHVIEAEEGQL